MASNITGDFVTTRNSPEVPLGSGSSLGADETREHQEHCEFDAHFVQFELILCKFHFYSASDAISLTDCFDVVSADVTLVLYISRALNAGMWNAVVRRRRRNWCLRHGLLTMFTCCEATWSRTKDDGL